MKAACIITLILMPYAIDCSSSAIASPITHDSVYVDIDKDFVDSENIPKDGLFFGKQSYYYIGDEDFEIVSSRDFQKKFTKSENDFLTFPQNKTQFWVKISFLNRSSQERSIFLFSTLTVTREISVYNKKLIGTTTSDDILPRRIISLNLKANSVSTFYIKRFSNVQQRQDFTFWKDKDDLLKNINHIERIGGFIFAVFFMSLIFSFMLWVSYRSNVYIFYRLYIIFFFAMTLLVWSIISIPNVDYISTILASMSLIAGCLFSIKFLNLGKNLRHIMFVWIILLVILIVFMCFDLQLGNLLSQYVAFLGCSSILLSALYIYSQKKEQHVAIFILAYGTLMSGYILQFLMWKNIIPFWSGKLWFYSATLENILMLLALADKIYNTEKERINGYEDIAHSYNQLRKVFYPHQLTSMKNGAHLETTMPLGGGEACVISLDVAGSSQIKAGRINKFLRDVFSSCNNLMIRDYQENVDVRSVVSNAFRIKEMGDGLICSVGFPYKSPTNDPFADALSLSEEFIEIFNVKIREFQYPEDTYCGCGIAYGHIETFYPDSTPVEYDAYGSGIVLACRYESMRKTILSSLGTTGNILILSETVYNSIEENKREQFTRFNLKEHQIDVRNDESADFLYYKITDRTT